MTISYPLTLPSSPGFTRTTWRARSQRVLSQSPFSLAQETISWSGQQWEVDFELPPMGLAEAEIWIAALLSLDGPVGTFLYADQANAIGRGTATGSLLLAGATAIGDKTIDIDGASALQADVFKAGDWMLLAELGKRQVFKVLQDVSADAGGAFTVDVWPFVRAVYPDNDTVFFTANSVLHQLRLVTPVFDWTVENLIYGVSFTAIEVVT